MLCAMNFLVTAALSFTPTGTWVHSGTHGLSPRSATALRAQRSAPPITMEMERTYIMIKPDGVQRGLVGTIIQRFEQRGYELKALKLYQASEELLNTCAAP